MLVRVLLTAIFAGVIAGAFAFAAQSVRVTPLILEAEAYENAGTDTHAGPAVGAHSHDGVEASQASNAAWAPADGMERTLFTLLSNILVGVAFSLILTAGIVLSGQGISLITGLVWGFCGFAAFVLAPNFGLPPELPGMAAGDLQGRQIWWLATVVCTGAGLWLFAFKRGLPLMVTGVALVVAPHVIGAPVPATHESAVPAHLAAEFAVATMVTSALFWLVLGALLGWLLSRLAESGNGSAQGAQ